MKKENNFELKVGIFVAIGIVIAFVMVFNIGEFKFIKKGYHVEVIFNFASGISESAPVRLAGVDVGWIERISLYYDEDARRTKVRLLAWIDDADVRIEKDAQATINTLGLLGEKYLEIFPGDRESGFLKNEDKIVGHDPVVVERLTEKMSELANSASVVMERLKEGEGTIGKLLTEEKIYNDLEAFVADIKKHPWKLLSRPRGTKREEKE